MNQPSLKISVFIPTKGNPSGALESVLNLMGLAKHTLSRDLEFILIIQRDEDPVFAAQYHSIRSHLAGLGISVVLLTSQVTGYYGLKDWYQEAYSVATGDIFLCFNDNVRTTTLEWDDAYRRALGPVPYGVASADVHEYPDGGNYQWAFPAVRRDLCTAIGCFCICSPPGTTDRVFDAYAGISGKGVRAAVHYEHEYAAPVTDSLRDVWVRFTKNPANWAKLLRQWTADARNMQDRVLRHSM